MADPVADNVADLSAKTTPPLWTAEEVARATGGLLCAHGEKDADEWMATGVSIDTRSLEPGDLFVALTGDARNGHAFVAKAFEAGAAAALVSEIPGDAPKNAPLVMTDETLSGLRSLGAAARSRAHAKRIAVTGSVGKTSAKEMLRVALGASGAVHASVKSYNNHWGVPLTLARMPADIAYGVFEIGMNHAGEIANLCPLVEPDAAIITAIAPAHLEFFKNLEGIAEAKAEIFIGLKPGGTAIINRDTPFWPLLSRRAVERGAGQVVGFGEDPGADYRLLGASRDTDGRMIVKAARRGEAIDFQLAAHGRHQALNALSVLAGVDALGGDLEAAIAALGALEAAEGRGRTQHIEIAGGRVAVIDESYNANPASMAAALSLLGETPTRGEGRRIAALGDMLELGETGPALHADVAEAVAAADVDLVFAAGPLMASLWDALPKDRRGHYAESSNGLIEPLKAELRDGDVLMAKGSLGSKMSLIIEALTTAPVE
ncbi:MAG: UDP-N-acetylmuramoylalanyl-D-glutamyl-2,6-diaminopimelate--D-alanyl-D-alanine ligase [Pseudomonadota bacterium]